MKHLPSPLRWVRRRPMTGFLLFSLFVHLFFLWYQRSEQPPSPMEPAPIELSQFPPPETQKRSAPKPTKKPEVAETEKLENNKLDPNTSFLGEKNQTAEQETAASQVDDFRKKMGTGSKGDSKNGLPPTGTSDGAAASSSPRESVSAEKSKPLGIKRDWRTLSLQDLGVGGNGSPLAATDDRLEGVDRADRTVLSTREFKFYSYYHRIKETLRQYWKPNVERKLALLWNKGSRMKDAELVTQVLVQLDKGGTITRISRVGSSGFPDLDEAAIEAFRQAAPFPNPPMGMVDPDGLVRIRWDFILKTEASPQISFRNASPNRRTP